MYNPTKFNESVNAINAAQAARDYEQRDAAIKAAAAEVVEAAKLGGYGYNFRNANPWRKFDIGGEKIYAEKGSYQERGVSLSDALAPLMGDADWAAEFVAAEARKQGF